MGPSPETTRAPEAIAASGALRQVASELVQNFAVLVKSALLFDLDNEVLERPLASTVHAVERLEALADEEASLRIVDGALLVSGRLARLDRNAGEAGPFLARLYAQLQIEALIFEPGFRQAELVELLRAIRGMVLAKRDPGTLAAVPLLKVVRAGESRLAHADEERADPRLQALRVYASAVAAMAAVAWRARRGLKWSPRAVRRVAVDLVDAVDKAPDLMVALLQVPAGDHPVAAHAVRVATVSALMSKELGCARPTRAEAALVALYHHMRPADPEGAGYDGEVTLADEDGALDVDPVEAAIAACIAGGAPETRAQRTVAVFDVASAAIGAGIERGSSALHPLARVGSVADRFDALLGELPPDEALQVVVADQDRHDPAAVAALVRAIGLYPVGTTVRLASGATAVVVESHRGGDRLATPVVRLTSGDDAGALVDIAEDSRHGPVVATLGPGEAPSTRISDLMLL